MGAKLHALHIANRLYRSRQHDRMVRKLAEALVIALNIQPGSSLVMLLGNGTERNNTEALCTWTNAELAAQGLAPCRRALRDLIPKLENELNSLLP